MRTSIFSERDFFSAIASNPVAVTIGEKTFTPAEVKAWAEDKVAHINAQYAKRADKRATKRDGVTSAIKVAVLDNLTAEPVALSSLTALVGEVVGETISTQKLTPILSELAEEGKVVREVGAKKRVMYRLA